MASLAASLLACPATAQTHGTYQTTYSGGSVTGKVLSSSGGPATCSNTPQITPFPAAQSGSSSSSSGSSSASQYSGSATVSANTDSIGGTNQCSAQIVKSPLTAAFTWQPNSTNPKEPAPSCAILTQTSRASWSFSKDSTSTASGSGPSNGLSNGVLISSTSDPNNQSAVCNSTLYSVWSGSSGSVPTSLSCSPSASVSGSSGPGLSHAGLSGSVIATYSVTATPVFINLGGAIQDSSGNYNILIGQACTASMSAAPFTLSDFHWSATYIFDQFLIASDQSVGYATPISAATMTQPNPTWHWSWDSGGGQFTVSCTATASINGKVIGTVTGQQQVKVWKPYYYMNHNAGPTGIYGSDVSTGSKNLVPPGMSFVAAVGTPALFVGSSGGGSGGSGGSSGGGTGSWLFVQIINTSHYQWYPWSPLPVKSGSLGVALDNEWPYKAVWPADSTSNTSTPQPAEDSPDLILNNLVNQFTINDIYQMYLMYLPPGGGSQYVPLHRLTWEWNANGLLDGTWPAGSSGQVTVDSDLRWETHPSWSQIYIDPHQ